MGKIWNVLMEIVLIATVINAKDDDGGMGLDEIVKAMEPFGSNCDPVPERENYVELILNEENPKPATKCFRHCLLLQFDVMKEGESRMDKEKTVELMSMIYPNREQDLNEAVEECNAQNAEVVDKCEAAHANGICLLNEMKARGFEIPEVKQ